MLRQGVIETLGRSRFLRQLESPDMPALPEEHRTRLLTRLGAVMRLLQVMLTSLPDSDELHARAVTFVQEHYRTITSFIEMKQGDLDGLHEVAIMVAVLAHTVQVPRPGLVLAEHEEYRRVVNELFERYAREMLPPQAVRFPGA
jgi:hypothetical protein